jgi:hypothetical protein
MGGSEISKRRRHCEPRRGPTCENRISHDVLICCDPLVVAHPTLRLDRLTAALGANGERMVVHLLLAEKDCLMARKECRSPVTTEQVLTCLRTHCGSCGRPVTVAYRTQRTITTLQGSCRFTLCVRRCRNPACEWYHRAFRPEEEGKWALPHGEFGLDVIALVGTLRNVQSLLK